MKDLLRPCFELEALSYIWKTVKTLTSSYLAFFHVFFFALWNSLMYKNRIYKYLVLTHVFYQYVCHGIY